MKKISLLLTMLLIGACVLKAQDSFVSSNADELSVMVANGGGLLTVSSGDIYLDGKELNEQEIKSLLGESGYEFYSDASRLRKMGITQTAIGAPILGVGFFSSFLVTLLGTNDNASLGDYIWVELFSSALVTVGTIFICSGNSKRRQGNFQLYYLANTYNNSNILSENFSIGLSPTLVSAPDGVGNRNYGLGAGLSINF